MKPALKFQAPGYEQGNYTKPAVRGQSHKSLVATPAAQKSCDAVMAVECWIVGGGFVKPDRLLD